MERAVAGHLASAKPRQVPAAGFLDFLGAGARAAMPPAGFRNQEPWASPRRRSPSTPPRRPAAGHRPLPLPARRFRRLQSLPTPVGKRSRPQRRRVGGGRSGRFTHRAGSAARASARKSARILLSGLDGYFDAPGGPLATVLHPLGPRDATAPRWLLCAPLSAPGALIRCRSWTCPKCLSGNW